MKVSPAAVSYRLARAYRLTIYTAPGLQIRIGRPARGWPFAGSEIVLIGACNPAGRRLPEGINARRMTALAQRLRAVPHRAGEGRLGRWAEGFFAAAIPCERGIVLARRFGQNAVVVVRRGQVARLVWLDREVF